MGILDVSAASHFKTINGVQYEFHRLTLGDVTGLIARYAALTKGILLETLTEEKADKETRLNSLYRHKLGAQSINNLPAYASTTQGMLDMIMTSLRGVGSRDLVMGWSSKVISDLVLVLLEVEQPKPEGVDKPSGDDKGESEGEDKKDFFTSTPEKAA